MLKKGVVYILIEQENKIIFCEICKNPKNKEMKFDNKLYYVEILCKCEEKKTEMKREKYENEEFLKKLNQDFFKFENYKNENLEKYKNSEASNFVIKFLNKLKACENQWFFLTGTVGNGKTTALKILCNEFIKKRINFNFLNVDGILQKIKSSYNSNNTESEEKIINNLITTKFLFLDDFGTECINSWSFSKIFTILNGKYENNTCVIFTSNLTKQKLAQKLTDFDADCRLLDRIKHKTTFVEFKNKSFRKNDFKF